MTILTSRIPRKLVDFFNYLINTTTYLLTTPSTPGAVPNWERLGLLVGEKDNWVQQKDDFAALWPSYSNKKTSRTLTVIENIRLIQRTFIEDTQPLLDRIAASPNVTIEDMDMFHIKAGPLRDNNPTRRTIPISQPIIFGLEPLGGGRVKFICRVNTDSTRASIAETADAVEVIWKVGATPPAGPSPEEAPNDFTSTKALFSLELGAPAMGQRIYAFCRWTLTHSPTLAGPWSGMGEVVVS